MTVRFAGDVRLNLMAKRDYRIVPSANGDGELYELDKPMMNETGRPLVYPFGFAPTLHRYRLDTLDKLKMGNNIFVGAMSDVFGDWVPANWIDAVYNACKKAPMHNYLFLTKNPQRYYEVGYIHEENYWYGTSVTCKADIPRINNLPGYVNRFVSIEPLHEDISPLFDYTAYQPYNIPSKLGWIIIGAETGKNAHKIIPKLEWINNILNVADKHGIPVFMKESLEAIVGVDNMRREFPEGLKKKSISPKVESKLYGNCNKCGKHMRKNEMVALLARAERGMQPKQYGFMCRECFEANCRELGAEIPLNKDNGGN
jgi:protein gp37